MKILIFGTGKFYQNRKEAISDEIEVAGFLDNNAAIWGTCVDNIPVYPPDDALVLDYDKIILCSAKSSEMKAQLLQMGIERESIWSWEKFHGLTQADKYRIYGEIPLAAESGKNILIISHPLGYHGGAMAAVYAANVLRERGYYVILAAPKGDEQFVCEMTKSGLAIVLSPALNYISSESEELKRFDIVLVNVFQMIQCACEISKVKPVLWWIHESSAKNSNIYPSIRSVFSEFDSLDSMKYVNAVAVSNIAKNNFNEYYPDKIRETLVLGIPDIEVKKPSAKTGEKTIFALIGAIYPLKAQTVFAESIGMLTERERDQAEFWIIGAYGNNAYYHELKAIADKIPQIKILGEMSKEEIYSAYRKIDVVVCPSLEDCLPIVMTEGMMYRKICIASETTGTADYIRDGENGFICKAGDPVGLMEKMRFILHHKDALSDMRNDARKTYEDYFTIEKFGDCLEQAIKSTIELYMKK